MGGKQCNVWRTKVPDPIKPRLHRSELMSATPRHLTLLSGSILRPSSSAASNHKMNHTQMHHGRDGAGSGPNSSTSRIALMYKRRRAVSACLACRTRKTKCDNVRPVCGFCSRNTAECSYSESSKDYSTYAIPNPVKPQTVSLLLRHHSTLTRF